MNNTLAVIVTYNRLNMLEKCVNHIINQTTSCDLLIVDNASTDDTQAWCQSITSDNIFYSNTGANLGGAGGFNYGIRKAAEMNYDYVWIMDDDSFPNPDCLEKLLEVQTDKIGFLSSVVLWTDGSLCKMNWQRKYYLPKNRNEHHLTDNDLKDTSKDRIRIQSATFVSLLFPIKVVKEVGLPIKEFFIWCDDIEYTRRISTKYGYPCYAVLNSITVHHTAANVGTDLASDEEARIPRYNYAFRNENYMYRQYGIKGFFYYILVCGYNAFKVIKNAKTHKCKRLGIIIKNFFTGLFFNPPVEKL